MAAHSGIRWWHISDKQGNGFEIIADSSLMTCSALHVFDSDLMRTPAKPVYRPETQLSIDRFSTAQASADQAWPSPVPYGTYKFTFMIKPLAPRL